MFSRKYLNRLRAIEIADIAPFFRSGMRILEIGAGTGLQALELQRRGFVVTAIEVADSAYADARVFPVIDYDGTHIPFPARSFDVVFSSNALEHVRDLAGLHAEIRRVLKPGGICVHVLPTHAWRFWSSVTSFPGALVAIGYATRISLTGASRSRLSAAWRAAARHCGAALVQPAHGERGHALTELWTFRPAWWRQHFTDHGFQIIHDEPVGLFYTGNALFGDRLPFSLRSRLAKALGSGSHVYVIRPA